MDPNEIAKLVAELHLETEAEKNVVEVKLRVDHEGVRSNKGRVRSLVVGKIFASRIANRETLRVHVPRILNIRNEVDIEIVGDNLFVVVFSNERERNHALNDGPWHFFDSFMAFKEPKGLEKPSDVQFTEFTTWIQCHNLLILCMNPNTIRRIGEAVGRVEEIDEGEGGNCLGQYARVRVTRDIDKPLQRCVKLQLDSTMESQTVLIRYERLPEFCSACGRLGHLVRHCADTTADKAIKAFGPWLRASQTQDLRMNRRSDVRRNKEDIKQHSSTGEETMANWGSRNREDEMEANNEEVGIYTDNGLATEIGTSEIVMITDGSNRVEARTQNPRGHPTEKNKDGAEGGCKERCNLEQETIDEVDHMTKIQPEKSEVTVRGWKRRARKLAGDHHSPATTALLMTAPNAGRKRGGETREEDISSPKPKQL